MKYKGGGIIFTSINPKGELVFLLGRENKYCNEGGKGKWCDFGGGNDGEPILENVTREATEEIMGFLGDKRHIRDMINGLNYQYTIGDIYKIYFIPIEYDEKLPYYFNNHIKIIEKYIHKNIIKTSKIFEKDLIKWFSIKDLEDNTTKLRKWFKITSKKIICEYKDIKRFSIFHLKPLNLYKKKNTRKGKKYNNKLSLFNNKTKKYR